jgi:hypothetical protein
MAQPTAGGDAASQKARYAEVTKWYMGWKQVRRCGLSIVVGEGMRPQ